MNENFQSRFQEALPALYDTDHQNLPSRFPGVNQFAEQVDAELNDDVEVAYSADGILERARFVAELPAQTEDERERKIAASLVTYTMQGTHYSSGKPPRISGIQPADLLAAQRNLQASSTPGTA